MSIDFEAAGRQMRELIDWIQMGKVDHYDAPAHAAAVVAAALDGEVLYSTEIPKPLKAGLHSHFSDGFLGPCVTCGATQRWVVQVWPEPEETADG